MGGDKPDHLPEREAWRTFMAPTPAPPLVPAPEPTFTPLAGPRLLQAITLRNFLSFGPEAPSLPLGDLNVLVGPNGSGKSNLLEAIALLRSTANDTRPIILSGGGIGEWIWKGAPRADATVDAVLANPHGP